MNSNRTATTIAGWSYIGATVAGILSMVPVIDDPEYLIKISAHETQVIAGAFFQLLMVAAYIGYAISLYPLLRKHNENLALGFISFWVIGGVFIIIGVIILLLFLTLSQGFVRSAASQAVYFQTLGELLRTGRDLVNHVGMILALSLGSIMCYSVLFRTRLVPRWLSGWGLIGTALTIFASLLLMFRLIGLITTIYVGLNFPLALQEMVLAVWLIVKGFNPTVVVSGSSRPLAMN